MNKFGSFRETYLLERNALYTLYKNLDDESLERVFAGSLLLAVRRAVARGDLDSASLDLRVAGDDSEPTLPISKHTAAGIYAIDQFVENLPKIQQSRERVQSTRVRQQRDIARLFGEIDQPAYPIDSYLRGYDKIVQSLSVLSVPDRRRVLVITGDPVGPKMAGPAIRAWNISKLLSDEHDVRLLSMTRAVSLDNTVEVGVISHRRPSSVVDHEKWADVIIVQGNAIALFPALAKSSKVLVVDVYDPLHLEQLEQGRRLGMRLWNKQISDATETLNQQLELGDFFLCASERQRHFWLGQLAGLGRVNAFNYARDNELDALIAVAPFGIPEADPVHTKPAIRGVVPGIGPDDKVIVWGGGIYDWFDPETLIRAVADIAKRHEDVRVFFMGVKHPNPDVPEMRAVARSRALADSLGLTGKHVIFNENWIAYDERQNYLLEADVGVSTHFQHVETTFSFRTRILDYLWTSLPIVTTEGDSFGDLVAEKKLGVVIPERDSKALAAALEKMLYDPKANAAARRNVQIAREDFFWPRALEPLVEFVRHPVQAADKQAETGKPKPRSRSKKSSKAKRRTGVLHDLDRVGYYLREGGPGAVLERVRARSERKRASSD
jgi:glycosyltransferase involved in cell wall biosynthesis